ncbi:glycosyltransferase [Dichotomopilus funicola]|uniref:Glycosyltransferase n=1 Tax=Dichotomopilus funicola TaxID=1934379 RepID=A0AAN6V1J8_9PEZI|nr:glycosyltransferase [Dichotomopilus funicola]
MDQQQPQGSDNFATTLRHVAQKLLFRGGWKARFSVVVLLLVAFAFLAHHPHFYSDGFYVPSAAPNRHTSDSHALSPQPTSPSPSGWWMEFFTRLDTTRVTARPITIKDWDPSINWKPGGDAVRPDLIKLREDDEAKFRLSHAALVGQLATFANHLPYDANTTGIVTTAGVPNFGQAISLVLTARRAGSRLPIQIVLDSTSAWVDWMCAETMPRYNAACVSLEEAWAGLGPLVPELERFQWKVISIVASTFQNVLFLDTDCLPVRNPDPIFDPGSEPFSSTGFISWPDFWTSTASVSFYRIAGDLEVPPVPSRPTSESGVMVFDKARHADTLLLAAYYNHNGPKHYYPLLSQHAAGEGDKETFLHAALVLDALRQRGQYQQPTEWMKPGIGLKKGYYDVKKLPSVHGRSAKGKWTGMFLQQTDPVADYRAVMAVVEAEAAKNGEPRRTRQQQTREERKHKGRKESRKVEEEDFLTDPSALATVAPHLPEHYNSGTMFFHHSGVKPDFTRVVDETWGLLETDSEGRYVRLWGSPDWIVDAFDRDVERLLWEDSVQVYCQEGALTRFERLRMVCDQLRVVYDQIYG